MHFISLLLTKLLLLSAFAAPLPIFHIHSLEEISVDQPENTLFFFDLDDTIFDSFSMLGSKAWRKYISSATKPIDPSENWHDIFSYDIAQKHPLRPVEPITLSFIQELQNKGYAVCGLTSRERNFWYEMPQQGIDRLTVNQLLSIGVNFNNGSMEKQFPFLSIHPEYFKGIFFANREPKGNYLLHIFNLAPHFPKKIIFIDDKCQQVESVSKALTSLGIPNECYLYLATDKKAKWFDPLIANIQLYYFYTSDGQIILSDEQAATIAKNTQEDAEYYLCKVLLLAKNKIAKTTLPASY